MRKFIVCIVGFVLMVNIPLASAQLLDSRINVGGPTTYAPNDPETRGHLYRQQVGYAGHFYNCDGEESKRCSPYIYWTTVCNQEQIRSWSNVLKCDVNEVRQRVRWGSCRGGSDCESCEQLQHFSQKATEQEETPGSFFKRGYASANPAAVKPKNQSRKTTNQRIANSKEDSQSKAR